MANKQFGQKDKPKKQQEGNLGQNEARQERDKENELSQMGEMSREANENKKQH